MFHPQGVTLAFQSFSFPHALLQLLLTKAMPADSACNPLFLLILCFNGYSVYPLVLHFVQHRWIALFGAVAAIAATPFPHGSTSPDLIMFGTLPLTLCFFHRAVFSPQSRASALASPCL